MALRAQVLAQGTGAAFSLLIRSRSPSAGCLRRPGKLTRVWPQGRWRHAEPIRERPSTATEMQTTTQLWCARCRARRSLTQKAAGDTPLHSAYTSAQAWVRLGLLFSHTSTCHRIACVRLMHHITPRPMCSLRCSPTVAAGQCPMSHETTSPVMSRGKSITSSMRRTAKHCKNAGSEPCDK